MKIVEPQSLRKVMVHLLKRYPTCQAYNMLWTTKREPPFRVLIGTILSQRSRDETTEKVAAAFFSKYKDVYAVAKAPLKEIERVIRPSGPYHQKARNIKQTCEMLVQKYNGKVPRTEEELMKLPGVGQKTCDCVLLYGYGAEVVPVDTHVHKLANIFGWVKTKTPEQTKIELEKLVKGNKRKVVNCVLVSLGQETRYNTTKMNKALGKLVPDIEKRLKDFQKRRKSKDFDR